MYTGSQQAIDTIAALVKEMKLKMELTEIAYRIDHEDYQVTFDGTHHCEIQAKTINDFIEFKNGDAKRQIQFNLNHPMPWQDWERPAKPGPQDEKMSVDEEI